MSHPTRSLFTPLRPTGALPPAGAQKPERTDPHPRRGLESSTESTERPTASYDVVTTIEVVGSLLHGEPVYVRSRLTPNGDRTIAIQLNRGHLLTDRSLKRIDTLVVRFLVGLALAEYINFWRKTPDGQALRQALTKAAGIEQEGRFWGIALASKLSVSQLLATLDTAPIFGPAPKQEIHQLFTLHGVQLHEVSDLANWRPKQELR